jgi:hypothetical protein
VNTSTNTAPSGKATPEQLHELHRLVVFALLADLKQDKPSAEVLSVARSLLKDNGLAGLAQAAKDRAALQRLWGLLLQQLTHAMESPSPSASLVAEVRLFLAANGINKDTQGHAATTQALASLSDAALPFVQH